MIRYCNDNLGVPLFWSAELTIKVVWRLFSPQSETRKTLIKLLGESQPQDDQNTRGSFVIVICEGWGTSRSNALVTKPAWDYSPGSCCVSLLAESCLQLSISRHFLRQINCWVIWKVNDNFISISQYICISDCPKTFFLIVCGRFLLFAIKLRTCESFT